MVTCWPSGATWHDLADDQQIRRGAAPARPRAAAPRPRPDRSGVRAAAGRRGARPRRAHVGRAPQPRVPARLWRVALRLPDDATHRARDGTAASWRPQRHRGLFRGRLLVAGHLQHSFHRTGRYAAQHLPAPRGARDGGDAFVRGETGDQTGQESRSAGHGGAASMAAMDITTATSGVTMTGSSTQGIKTVLHPVSDLAAAKAVYAALLGVAPQSDSSYYVGFDAEGQHIGLVPGGGPQGMTSPVAYWHVPDIEAKLAEVAAAGATVKEPAHDVGGGRLVATDPDPDGNVLGLLQDR